ncbi:MAG TPA: DNA polymerase [Gemmataceae bacterium]
MLRERDERPTPKHDPALVRRAAELVASCPAGKALDFGPLRFSAERWEAYLTRKGIPWPRLPSGVLALDDDTFREMARAYPADVAPIRELRHTLSQLWLNKLAVGADGRNRCLLSAFGAKTGRNTPSNNKFIYGPSVWLRSLIRPSRNRAMAYIDWSAQEYGIAAALSGDGAMKRDYQSGDPYLAFSKRAGAVPADATKQTHGKEREPFKVCCGLGAMYGAGEHSLAARLGISTAHARELRLHHQTYPTFWRWSDAVQDFAMLHGYLETVFGWRVHVGPDTNPRSLRNFPMQANGAEMLRLACCLATERGIMVCAPVHDALLVEADADEIDAVVARTQEAMREASQLVLPGFPLRTDPKIVRWPERYLDERGRRMWETVWRLLTELESEETTPAKMVGPPPPKWRTPPLI